MLTAEHTSWDSVVLLPRGERTLLMDRRTGKWAMLDESQLVFARLLPAPPESVPETLRGSVDRLRASLLNSGIAALPSTSTDDLNTLILKLTNACNYACTYCYDYESSEKALRLERSIAIAAVEQSLRLAPHSLKVILHGGEPMLVFPLITDIVLAAEAEAKRLDKTVKFVGQTNLSRLTDEVVAFSKEHGIEWGISIDGDPTINDTFRVLRDGSRTSHIFLDSLERHPEFVLGCGILSTITSANDSRLLEIARYFRDLGFRSWGWSLFQPVGRGRSQSTLLDFDVDRLIVSWGSLFDSILEGEFRSFAARPILDYVENFVRGAGRNMCMRRHCGAARDLLSVSADGTIEACDSLDPSGPYSRLGSLSIRPADGIETARGSPLAQLIRSRDVTNGDCGKCAWLAACGGTCLAHADSLNGVWRAQCHLALYAFDRISMSLATNDQSPKLLSYLESCT